MRCPHCGATCADPPELEALQRAGKKCTPIHAKCYEPYVESLQRFAGPNEVVSLAELQRRQQATAN